MNSRHSSGIARVVGVFGVFGVVVLSLAALGVAGCASRGARVAKGGEGIAARLGDRAARSPSAAALAERRASGLSALPRLARLNKDSPSLSELEAASRPAPQPVYVQGQYGPEGDSGLEPPPYWPPNPYGSCPPGGPCIAPGGYAVGGGGYFTNRVPHDAGTDSTGLASGVQGASAYRNPGEGDGAAHRPGTSTGTGPFEKTLEAERRAEAPPPSSTGSDRHGR